MARVRGLGHVLAEVDELWNQVRHVPVGGVMAEERATLEIGR